MDALIIFFVSFLLCLFNHREVEEEDTVTETVYRETKLNPTFYKDEGAFMEIAHDLGFANSIPG